MRRLGLVLALVLGAPAAALAQGEAIEGVISDQIQAFRADDFAEAFTFASPGIKRMFRTPDNFGRMVRQGYPMVWRPAEVAFLSLSEADGARIQRVMITDAEGRVHFLDYRMTRTETGWKIAGVRIVQPPKAGA